ncbi:MAG: hypothetical protein KAI76_07650, partial [Alphaproteobacteria bacterium]|nr:hypothetical protein [Alphaproteobacteria bacterium]
MRNKEPRVGVRGDKKKRLFPQINTDKKEIRVYPRLSVRKNTCLAFVYAGCRPKSAITKVARRKENSYQ